MLIPYKEWDVLRKEQDELKHKLQEAELMLRYKRAIEDAKLFEAGTLETYQITHLPNEL